MGVWAGRSAGLWLLSVGVVTERARRIGETLIVDWEVMGLHEGDVVNP